ncbi:MAG: flagellar hook capping FlgD N-terminal domain-containing protein [Planctomycetota bacterium]
MTTIATTPSIDPTTGTSSNGGTAVLSTKAATAGDNPFLKLLTEQLKNQTPLEPVDNASFMNQMASYTTMQEQRNLNTNMLKLLDFQGVLARMQGLGQGSALLGKEVTYAGDDHKEATGTVQSVFVNESGDVRLRLTGDKEIGMREVIGIAEQVAATTPPATPSTAPATPPAS